MAADVISGSQRLSNCCAAWLKRWVGGWPGKLVSSKHRSLIWHDCWLLARARGDWLASDYRGCEVALAPR